MGPNSSVCRDCDRAQRNKRYEQDAERFAERAGNAANYAIDVVGNVGGFAGNALGAAATWGYNKIKDQVSKYRSGTPKECRHDNAFKANGRCGKCGTYNRPELSIIGRTKAYYCKDCKKHSNQCISGCVHGPTEYQFSSYTKASTCKTCG